MPVLITAAVLSGFMVGLMALYESLSRATYRTDLRTEADGVFMSAYQILTSPTATTASVCEAGLQAAGGGRVPFVYNATGGQVGQIVAGGQTVYQLNQVFGNPARPSFRLTDMRVRAPRLDETSPPLLPVPGPGTYQHPTLGLIPTIAMKFTMRFQFTGAGAESWDRAGTLMVAYSGGQIQSCSGPQQAKLAGFRCNNSTLTDPVGGACPPATGSCVNVHYIAGFDGLGNPICRCRTSCTRYE